MTQTEMIRTLAEFMHDWATTAHKDLPKLQSVLDALGAQDPAGLEWGSDPVVEAYEAMRAEERAAIEKAK